MTSQTLAIDCGNTNIKWALYAAARDHDAPPCLLQSGAFATEAINQHLSILVATVLNIASQVSKPKILKVIVANVAGEKIAGALRCAFGSHDVSLRFIESQAAACGLTNGYLPPQTLGVDRFAALVAAVVSARELPQNQLVVLAGTALTIDALTSNGNFIGGLIVPGLNMMQTALHQRTAQLPLIAVRAQPVAFPTDTAAAIANGALQACVGAVMQQALAHHSVLQQAGESLQRLVVAGGAANVIVERLQAVSLSYRDLFTNFPHIAVVAQPNLVLDGLFYLAEDEVASPSASAEVETAAASVEVGTATPAV